MSGFLPDMMIIPDRREGMLDNLKTFCEKIVNVLSASARFTCGPGSRRSRGVRRCRRNSCSAGRGAF